MLERADRRGNRRGSSGLSRPTMHGWEGGRGCNEGSPWACEVGDVWGVMASACWEPGCETKTGCLSGAFVSRPGGKQGQTSRRLIAMRRRPLAWSSLCGVAERRAKAAVSLARTSARTRRLPAGHSPERRRLDVVSRGIRAKRPRRHPCRLRLSRASLELSSVNMSSSSKAEIATSCKIGREQCRMTGQMHQRCGTLWRSCGPGHQSKTSGSHCYHGRRIDPSQWGPA